MKPVEAREAIRDMTLMEIASARPKIITRDFWAGARWPVKVDLPKGWHGVQSMSGNSVVSHYTENGRRSVCGQMHDMRGRTVNLEFTDDAPVCSGCARYVGSIRRIGHERNTS